MEMKTKQLRWLAALLLLVAAMVMPSVAWAQITPEQPQEGIGTKDNPYKISSAEQLYWFAGLVNGDASVCNYDENANPSGTQQNKGRTRQTLWEECTDANPKLSLNDT